MKALEERCRTLLQWGMLPALQQPSGLRDVKRSMGFAVSAVLRLRRDQAVTPAQCHGDRCGLAMLQLTWGSFDFSFLGDC